MATGVVNRSYLLLGQCVPCVKRNASKFKVKRMELDKNLLMYFRKDEYIYAHDPGKKCKTGDIVLIQQLPQKMTTLITHEVKDIIYPLGDITDPITGKKVVADKYRDDISRAAELFGKNDDAFCYEDAPERGWQEDRKDFTHRRSYIKYHVYDNDNQRYAV
ncbi:28S ribosomal protein S17, mitochondrial [Schistocerca americana]|uniref:28S ribosomal protein S17, mitochondrial n=1 Tax=Schistocerca americana TaxID=7009 RepID=UPI001F5014B7|nr:28S ribosomal protein S17, mitochondrial [Schistocerca americana]XP_047117818.1 28S ribosomal protein S17, mitochondrial [Schistocerca piceifrons]XP_049830841.1 28S ribosomal protein S17, mitochondrial [Schistocerca gregaria]XP_049963141.1 28S ribosomal protein S17, mitochondrial [Schistocerca serialis cubense]